MTTDPTDPTYEVPDADWAEQQAETDPLSASEDRISGAALSGGIPPEANEADALEQLSEIPLDDEP